MTTSSPGSHSARMRGGDRLGGAGGDEHLGVGVERRARRSAAGARRSACAQLGDAGARRVLVVPGADRRDRGLGDLGGPSVSGKPWPRLIDPVAHGQRRHLGEDRLAEPPHAGDDAGCGRSCAPQRRSAAGADERSVVVVEAEAHLHRHLVPAHGASRRSCRGPRSLRTSRGREGSSTPARHRFESPGRCCPATSRRSRSPGTRDPRLSSSSQ